MLHNMLKLKFLSVAPHKQPQPSKQSTNVVSNVLRETASVLTVVKRIYFIDVLVCVSGVA